MSYVVNLIGSPGTGKSTMAALVFAELKMQGINAELVTEYAKDLVWENRTATFDDELYIFAKQNHRLFRLKDKVDVIITDAPIILKLHYMPKEFDFSDTVLNVFNQYNNLNYLLQRKHQFSQIGRNENESQSDLINDRLQSLMGKFSIPYKRIESGDAASIVSDIVCAL